MIIMLYISKLIGILKYQKQKLFKEERYIATVRNRNYLKSCIHDLLLPKEEVNQIVKFLSRYLIEMNNYPFIHKYLYRYIRVYVDKEVEMNYVLHNKKRLYFKRGMTKSQVRYAYNYLCIEQDKESPHSYNFEKINFVNEVVADIGAAEGIWGLNIIDKVKMLYLFECDERWVEALSQTFLPWKEKVFIVQKYVSDKVYKNNISLDSFFYLKNIPLSIIKADIEGSEIDMLLGAKNMINAKWLKHLIVCTYHRNDDYENICKILRENKYQISSSKGFLAMYNYPDLSQVFRKGVVHGKY